MTQKFALLLMSFTFLKSQLVRVGEGEKVEPKQIGELMGDFEERRASESV